MSQEPDIVTSEQWNNKVASIGTDIGSKIRTNISALTSKGKGDLLKSFRMKTRKYYGEIDKISYHFQRHGVFWHKGVGRGYAMQGGNVVRVESQSKLLKEYARRKNRELRPRVLIGAAISRIPVDWFNPVINDNIERLANAIAEMRADQVVNATKIHIK